MKSRILVMAMAITIAALALPAAASADAPTYKAAFSKQPSQEVTRHVVTYRLTVTNLTGETLNLRAGLSGFIDPGTDNSSVVLIPHVLKKHNNVPFSKVGGCNCLGKTWKFTLAAHKRHTYHFQIKMVALDSYILDANLVDYTHPVRDRLNLHPVRARKTIKIVS